MPDIIIEQLCFLLELICYLTLISSLSGIPIKKMRHPFIALSSNFFICSVLSYIFSNALGWIILCLCCFITFSYILHVSFFKSSIAYVLSYALLSLIQDIVVMAFNRFSIQDKSFSSFLGSAISTILILILCRFINLNKWFLLLMEGSLYPKYLILHLYVLYMVEIGLSKYSAININALIPLISFFTVIVLITDIVILSQQQIISKQQHDLANYNVYQPMMDDLIEDVTGRQHDFDNILTGIRMLPYTHTDYSSLKEALISSSDEVISEYRTTELLKINMFVIAGFIYSKQKQAEKAHKKLNIVVHSYLLESRMPEYELVRVLGILIDNALEASANAVLFDVAQSFNPACYVLIGMSVLAATFSTAPASLLSIITTLNKGPLLTPEIRAKLFTAGYTTKTCDRQKHGLGLYNLRRLVFKYNGKIYLENDYLLDDTLVRFEVMV